MEHARARPIVLVGLMGSGKSAVGRALARRLDRRFLDTDERVVEAAGMSVAQIFEAEGEDGFRQRETDVVRDVVESGDGTVVSTGGGVVERDVNIEVLDRAFVVWLRADVATLSKRVGSGAGRPLLAGAESPSAVLAQLASRRSPRYGQVADLIVDTDDLTIDQVAERVVESIGVTC